jgi:hypothetical protein
MVFNNIKHFYINTAAHYNPLNSMELKLNLFILDYNLILIYKLYMQSTKRLKVETTGLRSPKLSPTYTLHWHCETMRQGYKL